MCRSLGGRWSGEMDSPQGGHAQVWHDYWIGTPDSRYLRAEADVFASRVIARFELDGDDHVLDFGCGYGHVSEMLATRAGVVWIWDRVESDQATALERIGGGNVEAADLGRIEETSEADLVIVNSVIQYMTDTELGEWMPRWASMLAPEGRILISDVPTDRSSLFAETIRWFALALRHRVLIETMRFARENAARYRSAREKSALAMHSEARLRELAADAGLRLHREPANLAFQPRRASFVLARGRS